MSYMGLDIGTTACKAVVFDEKGRQLASAYREYPTLIPQEGWAELDPRQVSESCFTVIREAASSCDDPVRAIGISCQGEAFTAVSSDREILGNAMVSFDTRAAKIAEVWSDKFGRERLYEITGHTTHSMFTLFKLLWLRENRPDIWSRAHRFYCFEDLIHHKLGLEPAISWPLAGQTMMFNVRTHQWDEAILDSAGLDKSSLAWPLPSGAVVGTVPISTARELGLPDETIVVTGGHDQPCAALGVGITSPGRAVYGIGTVECICAALPSAIFSEELYRSNLWTYDYTFEGMYTTLAFSLTGGNLLKWFRDEWVRSEVDQAKRQGVNPYELILNGMTDEPANLMVLPYFTTSGTPYFDSEVAGAIIGLRLSTKRSEVLRALLEGVAYEMRLNLEILDRSGIEVSELIAVGGGSKNRRLIQLKADVMNRPITTVAVTEAGCLGVAMLACAAHTGQDTASLARYWVRATEVVEPNPENVACYNDRFPMYLKLYPTLKTLAGK
ncbi:MAG: hypothetical protein A2Z18_03915 [Armatimonadetes bacterium RBG_16_58_9]|nr:MAG: hypothetical protein A2Z18_03915 [Armatimonadetes bacterium RBG_16_58_9]